jgi:diguanylate cyclase (GGDEF)-like protein
MPEGTNSPEYPSKGLRTFIERAKEIKATRNRGNKDAVLRTAIEQKQEESEIDPLTGLLNQKGFMNRLNLEIERAKRSDNKIALIFFDLNRLKKVNDELGHPVGDEYLKIVAQILLNSFRPTDLVARQGDKADEFLVAVPIENIDQAIGMHQRVVEIISEANQNWPGYEIVLPAGIQFLDFNNIQKSKTEADHAMYQAKERSRVTNQSELQIF